MDGVSKVAERFLAAKAFHLNVGDPVLYGKYKNKQGVIVGFGEDAKKNPIVYVDPVPKGRKQTKAIQLFRIWYDSSKDEELEEVEQVKQAKVDQWTKDKKAQEKHVKDAAKAFKVLLN